MKIMKILTWLALERDFRITGLMKKTKLNKKFPDLFSFLVFRMSQNSSIYEIFLGIRSTEGKIIS